MAEDEALAARVRAVLADEPELTERRMFGGLGFMLGGHMAVAVSGQGGLMVRCDPAATDRLLDDPAAFPMEMRGRELKGWLLVDDARLGDADVARWVSVGRSFVATLPPKGR